MPQVFGKEETVTLKGSCLCGAVRYEVDHLDTPIGCCHCGTCRKAHAAPYTATARVARDHFHLIAGEEKLSAFESSPGRMRRFCSGYGSHIVAERAEQPHVVLRVATLDEDPTVRPVVHIWTRMTCHGSPRKSLCRAILNGRPDADIGVRRGGVVIASA